MEPLAYFIVDAFTDAPFAGNPAAVVLDADRLDDQRMQAVAAEFNLSETAFVLKPTIDDADLRIRWFTPTAEVRMCGHATIAAVHALLETGRLCLDEFSLESPIRIETASGVLESIGEPIAADRPGLVIWLSLPTPVLTERPVPVRPLAEALRLPEDALVTTLPCAKTQEDDLIVMVKSVQVLNEALPDFDKLAEMARRDSLRGLCLATTATLTSSITVQSRFFAPAFGINEDPVTGSVHGPLAAFLVKHGLVAMHDGVAGLHCVQGKAGGRAGLIRAIVSTDQDGGYEVRIAGQAVTTMRGSLLV